MAQIDFDDEAAKRDIARLVMTVDNDHRRWDAAKTNDVLATFFQDNFFYLALPEGFWNRVCAQRPNFGRRLATRCSQLRIDDTNRIKPELISRVLRGEEGVTLEQILALDRMLAMVADSGDPAAVRDITIDDAVFRLPPNSVMPSLYAINRDLFVDVFRTTRADSWAAASTVVFGAGADYFTPVLNPPVVKAGGASRRKSCRISRPTATRLHAQLEAYMNGAPRVEEVFSDARTGSFTGGPNYSYPLSPKSGNLMQVA
jgi:hypothetical protein